MFADECQRIHRHALSHPGEEIRNRNPCDVGRLWGKKQGGSQPGEQRASMREQGLATCASVDDMFGVVPHHLADAFFLSPGRLHLRPMGGARFGYRGWNVTRNAHSVAAAVRTYGPQLNPVTYYSVCGSGTTVNFLSAREVGEDLMEYKDASGTPVGPPSGSACCEGRMTARLLSRLVPLRYVPFGFNSQFGMGGSFFVSPKDCAALERRYRADSARGAAPSSWRGEIKACHRDNPGLVYC